MAIVTIAGFGSLLGLVAGEIALRIVRATAPPQYPRIDPETQGLPTVQGIYGLAAPNQRVVYQAALWATNSRGIRGPELELPKPDGTFRIAVLGDSISAGHGVPVASAYPTLLEAALNGIGEKRRYEVVNASLPGNSLRQSVEHRLPIALEYAPDLFIYGFTINDLEGPSYRPLLRIDAQPSGSLLFDSLLDGWKKFRDVTWPRGDSYVRELDDNFFHNPGAWGDFTDALQTLRRTADERGACLVMFVHTQLMTLNSWHQYQRHYAAAARAAAEMSIPVVESFEYFRGLSYLKYWRNIHDAHPNEEGHQIMAEALLQGLRTLPVRCWKRERGA
ncbi:MAG TPA: GDSL-type esterase/lipase family protein [Candidatus Binatia bacterium]|nr:GDSL-type esterase/lipase family protein [Candidatus Binatia bacterium]